MEHKITPEIYCMMGKDDKKPKIQTSNSIGKWYLERSSGYLGFRCARCATWVYYNQELKCDCDGKR